MTRSNAEDLGACIRRRRRAREMRQDELALDVGIKQPYVSAIEHGRRVPRINVLSSIAKALETTAWELLKSANI